MEAFHPHPTRRTHVSRLGPTTLEESQVVDTPTSFENDDPRFASDINSGIKLTHARVKIDTGPDSPTEVVGVDGSDETATWVLADKVTFPRFWK